MKKINLKAVAEKAEVSIMSVSRAVHNKPGLSKETRERILGMAREMGYIPNRLAGSIGKGGPTKTIGVIIPNIEHTIFPDMLKGIEQFFSAEGYRLFLCCSYNGAEKEYSEVSALLERQVDEIIWVPATLEASNESLKLLQIQQCPFVFMDRIIPGIEADSVIVDDYEGAFQAVKHLIEQGCSRIAHITDNTDSWISIERMRGYSEALKSAGIEIDAELIMRSGVTIEGGMAGMKKLLSFSPDAVFAVNDPVAIGAFKTLREHGIKVPEDVALVGFSSTLALELMAVPLSTVFQDGTAIGNRAAKILLERIDSGNKKKPSQQILKTHLIIRESSVIKQKAPDLPSPALLNEESEPQALTN